MIKYNSSNILVYDIWAEDLFRWFYYSVIGHGGDGAGVIICSNYKDCAKWFIEWWTEKIKPEFPTVNFEGREFWHPRDEYDGIINYHDCNENFMFTDRTHDLNMFRGDYLFIVKEDCHFAFVRKDSDKIIKKAKVYR